MIRPAPEQRYALEDYLAEIRQSFARYAHDGIRLHPDDVCDVLTTLGHAIDEAARMRNELSRNRWNDRAASNPLIEIVLAEAARPGTNLVFFPVAARPIPADAPQLNDGGGVA